MCPSSSAAQSREMDRRQLSRSVSRQSVSTERRESLERISSGSSGRGSPNRRPDSPRARPHGSISTSTEERAQPTTSHEEERRKSKSSTSLGGDGSRRKTIYSAYGGALKRSGSLHDSKERMIESIVAAHEEDLQSIFHQYSKRSTDGDFMKSLQFKGLVRDCKIADTASESADYDNLFLTASRKTKEKGRGLSYTEFVNLIRTVADKRYPDNPQSFRLLLEEHLLPLAKRSFVMQINEVDPLQVKKAMAMLESCRSAFHQIFNQYCVLESAQSSETWINVSRANQTMDLKEFQTFSQNWFIVPNLVNFASMEMIFQAATVVDDRNRENAPQLEFNGFLECIAKVAILTESKYEQVEDKVRALLDHFEKTQTSHDFIGLPRARLSFACSDPPTSIDRESPTSSAIDSPNARIRSESVVSTRSRAGSGFGIKFPYEYDPLTTMEAVTRMIQTESEAQSQRSQELIENTLEIVADQIKMKTDPLNASVDEVAASVEGAVTSICAIDELCREIDHRCSLQAIERMISQKVNDAVNAQMKPVMETQSQMTITQRDLQREMDSLKKSIARIDDSGSKVAHTADRLEMRVSELQSDLENLDTSARKDHQSLLSLQSESARSKQLLDSYKKRSESDGASAKVDNAKMSEVEGRVSALSEVVEDMDVKVQELMSTKETVEKLSRSVEDVADRTQLSLSMIAEDCGKKVEVACEDVNRKTEAKVDAMSDRFSKNLDNRACDVENDVNAAISQMESALYLRIQALERSLQDSLTVEQSERSSPSLGRQKRSLVDYVKSLDKNLVGLTEKQSELTREIENKLEVMSKIVVEKTEGLEESVLDQCSSAVAASQNAMSAAETARVDGKRLSDAIERHEKEVNAMRGYVDREISKVTSENSKGTRESVSYLEKDISRLREQLKETSATSKDALEKVAEVTATLTQSVNRNMEAHVEAVLDHMKDVEKRVAEKNAHIAVAEISKRTSSEFESSLDVFNMRIGEIENKVKDRLEVMQHSVSRSLDSVKSSQDMKGSEFESRWRDYQSHMTQMVSQIEKTIEANHERSRDLFDAAVSRIESVESRFQSRCEDINEHIDNRYANVRSFAESKCDDSVVAMNARMESLDRKNTSDVTRLSGAVETLSSGADRSEHSLQNLDSEVKEMWKRFGALQTETSEKASSLSQQIDALSHACSTNTSEASSTRGDIQAVEERVNENVGALRRSLELIIESKVSDMGAKVDSQLDSMSMSLQETERYADGRAEDASVAAAEVEKKVMKELTVALESRTNTENKREEAVREEWTLFRQQIKQEVSAIDRTTRESLVDGFANWKRELDAVEKTVMGGVRKEVEDCQASLESTTAVVSKVQLRLEELVATVENTQSSVDLQMLTMGGEFESYRDEATSQLNRLREEVKEHIANSVELGEKTRVLESNLSRLSSSMSEVTSHVGAIEKRVESQSRQKEQRRAEKEKAKIEESLVVEKEEEAALHASRSVSGGGLFAARPPPRPSPSSSSKVHALHSEFQEEAQAEAAKVKSMVTEIMDEVSKMRSQELPDISRTMIQVQEACEKRVASVLSTMSNTKRELVNMIDEQLHKQQSTASSTAAKLREELMQRVEQMSDDNRKTHRDIIESTMSKVQRFSEALKTTSQQVNESLMQCGNSLSTVSNKMESLEGRTESGMKMMEQRLADKLSDSEAQMKSSMSSVSASVKRLQEAGQEWERRADMIDERVNVTATRLEEKVEAGEEVVQQNLTQLRAALRKAGQDMSQLNEVVGKLNMDSQDSISRVQTTLNQRLLEVKDEVFSEVMSLRTVSVSQEEVSLRVTEIAHHITQEIERVERALATADEAARVAISSTTTALKESIGELRNNLKDLDTKIDSNHSVMSNSLRSAQAETGQLVLSAKREAVEDASRKMDSVRVSLSSETSDQFAESKKQWQNEVTAWRDQYQKDKKNLVESIVKDMGGHLGKQVGAIRDALSSCDGAISKVVSKVRTLEEALSQTAAAGNKQWEQSEQQSQQLKGRIDELAKSLQVFGKSLEKVGSDGQNSVAECVESFHAQFRQLQQNVHKDLETCKTAVAEQSQALQYSKVDISRRLEESRNSLYEELSRSQSNITDLNRSLEAMQQALQTCNSVEDVLGSRLSEQETQVRNEMSELENKLESEVIRVKEEARVRLVELKEEVDVVRRQTLHSIGDTVDNFSGKVEVKLGEIRSEIADTENRLLVRVKDNSENAEKERKEMSDGFERALALVEKNIRKTFEEGAAASKSVHQLRKELDKTIHQIHAVKQEVPAVQEMLDDATGKLKRSLSHVDEKTETNIEKQKSVVGMLQGRVEKSEQVMVTLMTKIMDAVLSLSWSLDALMVEGELVQSAPANANGKLEFDLSPAGAYTVTRY